MPLIPSNYINSWYRLQDINDLSKYYVAKGFNSTFQQTVEKKNLIQGDGGNHVFSAREGFWTTGLSGPILIRPTKEKNDILFTEDLFTLAINKFQKIKNYFTYVDETLLGHPENSLFLKTSDLLTRINLILNANTLDMDIQFANNINQMFNILDPREDFVKIPKGTKFQSNPDSMFVEETDKIGKIENYSRLAKFYDCYFYIPENNKQLLIKSGNISIDIDYVKLFLINSNTSQPFYEPKGYNVSGTVEIIIPPDMWKKIYTPTKNDRDRIIPGQNFMQLVNEKFNCSIGLTDGRILKLGLVNLTSNIVFGGETEGQLPFARVQFESYASVL